VIAVPNVEEVARAAYRYLNEQAKPFVFTARWPEDIPADSVATDGFYGARQMVTYLLQLGHRHIAYVEGYPHQPDVRLRGYKQGLSDAGVPLNESLIVLLDQPADEAGLTATRQLLRQRIDFSAIFARNDLTAVGVLRGLSEAGLKVPADVSVVGFDSTKLSAHLQPPLTTVDHTLHEIGRQAVLLLLDRIEGRYTGPARRITIEPRLVVRESCRALT
jgi:DNA-binding LacI/PurR family transcriptional regulator